MRRFPLAFATFILTLGSFGIALAKSVIEVFLCAELVSIAFFYVFYIATIPAIFPRKTNSEAIFLGGAAKPPYVSSDEILSPQLPFILGKIDRSWELYYNAEKFKPRTKEKTN